jgi:hypothetical protein
MKSQVAVYSTHENALNAVKALKNNNFPMNRVSILGKAEIIDDHLHVRSLDPLKNTPALLGVGTGTVLGLLSGVGAFAIPGFGFLYGAGALIGAIGGFDVGVVTGGIVTLLATIGIKKDKIVRCHEHLKEGKFLVIVNGTVTDIENAEHILHTEGSHLEFVHNT